MNVASQCGTRQYEGYKRFEQHKDDGLVIVGVPCNQFGVKSRERPPKSKVQANWVTFPLLEKQDVNGKIAQLCIPLSSIQRKAVDAG